jgi:signal transduction histidine kinase
LRLERQLERGLDENARARSALQELSAKLERAQENERRTLARELHDEVGQSLSAILMEAENAECATDAGEMRDHLAAVKKLAGKTVNEVRDLALLLRPSMLDDFGLLPALEWQAREIGKRTGLRVRVSSEMHGELPEEHKICVYRVVQEALNNCAQHAQASAAQVSVRHADGQIVVTVQDDGSGFDPERVRGLGLLGMEERARHLGGTFHIDSRPGRGTVLRVALPRDVAPQEPEPSTELLWTGVPYGADSHLAG